MNKLMFDALIPFRPTWWFMNDEYDKELDDTILSAIESGGIEWSNYYDAYGVVKYTYKNKHGKTASSDRFRPSRHTIYLLHQQQNLEDQTMTMEAL